MGRKVRRVPLDFDWPLDETWRGFINPYYDLQDECKACGGSGSAPEARRLSDEWYGNAPFDPVAYGSKLFAVDTPAVRRVAERQIERAPEFYGTGERAIVREANRLIDIFNGQWMHHLSQDDVHALWLANRLYDFRRVTNDEPTAAQVNEWSLGGFGHDSINQWVCCKARCEREGHETTCKLCGGNGHIWRSKAAENLCDGWEKTEPPTGDAHQIWQTVSEGGPISPPFLEPRELAEWIVANPWGGQTDMTAEDWEKFIRGPGWAPSMMITTAGCFSGTKAMVDFQDEKEPKK